MPAKRRRRTDGRSGMEPGLNDVCPSADATSASLLVRFRRAGACADALQVVRICRLHGRPKHANVCAGRHHIRAARTLRAGARPPEPNAQVDEHVRERDHRWRQVFRHELSKGVPLVCDGKEDSPGAVMDAR